ncbi:MAG: FAD-binding protein [Acidimicrobiales bacterium]
MSGADVEAGFRLEAGSPRLRLEGAGCGSLPSRRVPAVVLGAGVAGLSAALGLDAQGVGCVVVTEGRVGAAGSSPLAQGGVAAAIGADDHPSLHADDTVAVAAGIGDPRLARILADGGPDVIDALVALGIGFDRSGDGSLALGREAGHSRRRIVHANGDATGAAVVATLAGAVRARPGIELAEHTTAVDLIRGGPGGERVVGVVVAGPDGRHQALLAPAVILATGGYGHCFARTTVPADVTGAGIALAARAGVTVADLELVQFHPTALDVTRAPGAGRAGLGPGGAARLPLLTEALRGEGAILVNNRGERYMAGEHPDAELAPRDVVARANYRQLQDGLEPCLDTRAAVGEAFPQRFPTVFALAMEHGLDPRVDLLPVTPAAHYCMGGVAVDDRGRTSRPGLWAAGEVASSGLHGGNRLASNSLLEGLVMGRRVADAVVATSPSFDAGPLWLPADLAPPAPGAGALPADRVPGATGSPGPSPVLERVRAALWDGAGVVRHRAGMEAALDTLSGLDGAAADPRARSALVVARLVLSAGLARTESRGAHFRSDHPAPDPAQAARRLVPQPPAPARVWHLATDAVPIVALAG